MLVHPNLTVRLHIKQTLAQLGWCINQEASLSGALEKIRSYEPFDVVCVSLRFERKMLTSWLDTARAVIRGRYSVYSALATKEDRANPSYEIFVKKHFDTEISESIDASLLDNYSKQVKAKLEEKKLEKLTDLISLQLGKNLDAADQLAEITLLGRDFKTANQWISLTGFHDLILKAPGLIKARYLEMLKNNLLARASTEIDKSAEESQSNRNREGTFINPSARPKVDFVVKRR